MNIPTMFADAKLIGRGGFGFVYRAKFVEGGMDCAIKFANPKEASSASYLLREAEVLKALDGRCGPTWFAQGKNDDGIDYVAMSFIDAPTLAEVMERRERSFDSDQRDAIVQGILSSITRVHECGFLHRDIKPENFFVQDDGTVKVFDFGLSVRAGDQHAIQEADKWTGTPEYMAPEQCEGRRDLGLPSDVYALGVLLFELCCGHPPFWGTEAEIREAHRSRRPPLLTRIAPNIPRSISDVVHRCLRKDPARRFASAKELRVAWNQAIEQHQTAQRSGSTNEASPVAPVASTRSRSGKAKSQRERQTVGLLWVVSSESLARLSSVIEDNGGQIAETDDGHHVAVFGHESSENPVRAALQGARALLLRSLCEQAVVDVAAVSVRVRPDGRRSFASPLFRKRERYARLEDPKGILISSVASELVPESPTRAIERDGFAHIDGLADASQATIVRQSSQQFFGHEGFLRELERGASAAVGGTPTVVTIVAGAGYGKSHLASELASRMSAGQHLVDVEAMRALEPIGNAAFGTLEQLLRRVLQLVGVVSAKQGIELLRSKLDAELFREISFGLSIALGWVSDNSNEMTALRAAPGAIRSTVSLAAGKLLRHLAARRPMILIIDDAQFADETVLDAIEYATLKEGQSAIWACLIARANFSHARPNYGERAAKWHHEELGPLNAEESALLARYLLHPVTSTPQRALTLLFERTRGVPLMMVELIRGLRRDGVMRPSERGNGWVLATDELEQLPSLPAVDWLAAKEVAALPEQLASMGQIAALLGASIRVDELELLIERLDADGVVLATDMDARVALRRLRAAGILVIGESRLLQFRHEPLRDVMYKSLDPAFREAAHRCAFHCLDELASLSGWERLSKLAYHADRAGLRNEAARSFLVLARRARDQHAYLEAESLFVRALDNMDESDPRRLDTLWSLATMRFRLGRNEQSLSGLEDALALAATRGETSVEIDILLDIATVLDWLDDYGRSAKTVEAAQEKVGSQVTPLVQARLELGFGRSAMRSGRMEEAAERTLEAANRAEALGDEGYETHVIALLLAGASLGMLDRGDDAMQACTRAIRAAKEHSDQLHLGSALQNRSFVWIARGNIPALLEDMQQVIDIARESGSDSLEGRTVYNKGEVAYLLGKYDEALEMAERSVELARLQTGAGMRTLVSLLLASRIHVMIHEFERAAKWLAEFEQTLATATAQGRDDAELSPADQVLHRAVHGALFGLADEEWEELFRQSWADSIQQEKIEVVELGCIAAEREGNWELAQRRFCRVQELAQEVPHIMDERLSAHAQRLRQRLAS